MTSTQTVRYTDNVMERITESIVPSSDIVARATVLDGFTLSQIDQLGGSYSFTRQYTATGIWRVIYNAENRPVTFTSEDGSTVIESAYPSGPSPTRRCYAAKRWRSVSSSRGLLARSLSTSHMGRRAWKKVTVDGTITKNERYPFGAASTRPAAQGTHSGLPSWLGVLTLKPRQVYRGYLQITAIDLMRIDLPAVHYLIWDPTEPQASRPLALQAYGTCFTYGLDLSKNVKELFNTSGLIATPLGAPPLAQSCRQGTPSEESSGLGVKLLKSQFAYDYLAFGEVSVTGSKKSPVQWSSEVYDEELALVYYNYRHYKPADGRWINHDPIGIKGGLNLYAFVGNKVWLWDELGFMSLSECNKTLNNVVANPGRHSRTVRMLFEHLEDNKCEINIKCECVTLETEGMGGGYYKGELSIISDYTNTAQDLLETLIHELTHAKQECDTGLNTNCDTVICEEIQAYRESGQFQRTDPGNVRAKVTEYAAKSCGGEKHAYSRAKALYERCFKTHGNLF